MRVVTYLGFTLLSILIQFCVMDYIQGRMRVEEKRKIDFNATSKKRELRDVLKDFNAKPIALYYRSNEKIISNTSLVVSTTEANDLTTTVFDVLYDDNITATEETYTTETLYTYSEFDNVTEITFFGNNNQTGPRPDIKPKKTLNKDCNCNFLYKVCDIHCCCDSDCSDVQIKLFPNCGKNPSISIEHGGVCYNDLAYFGQDTAHRIFDNLLCIVKTNLPHKTNIGHQQINRPIKTSLLTWKKTEASKLIHQFSKKMYKYGDPVWLLRNGTIYYFDVPSPSVNDYCAGRKPVSFLKSEYYQCTVKLKDLEMLQFITNLDDTNVISVTPMSMNSTIMNCSSLHCVNWTILACNVTDCVHFNKSIHEPSCSDTTCTNLAFNLEYIFYYQENKVVNATIKFYLENISANTLYIPQTVRVKFVLTNDSADKILKLSGNPGYVEGLPIIVSYSLANHTESFFNKSSQMKNTISLPRNVGGICVSPNVTDNFILFGINKRSICKYRQNYMKLQNRTKECENLQHNILKFLNLKSNFTVSPLGNPQELKDEAWLLVQMPRFAESPIYGKFNEKTSTLECYNMITRFFMIFSYFIKNGHNNIVSVNVSYTKRNASLIHEDVVEINLVIDINFVDITKASEIEALTPPNLNFHIPSDFFYPFPSNDSCKIQLVFHLLIFVCITIYGLQIK